MSITNNISNLFLVLSIVIWVKNLYFSVKSKDLDHGKQALQIKWQYQSSIKNQILYLNITSIHKSLNKFPQSQKVELAPHVGHCKHGKQEKKI